MSQEPDVKPKLNLQIQFEGNHVTVKVKADMQFAKIFKAAETKFNKTAGTLKFTYDGVRIQEDQTPANLGMEDGDLIDAFLEQIGGCNSSPILHNSR
ncbi:ubiquitin-related domain-containing protein [Lentinula raphanica]|uniref:Ubiquitin-related domain-containing protein n=1 Tax=Lentinula raphanica TaxID=153919 RepID=A0AA38UHG5_9AGAR|nr:ubiquitin-related domain-containing protein [Lentinula raphanica]KAJ3773151.1 ubiquitin-related domain-containing protein [Lentinula raphanica]KAJ3841932.1 ubiquitin-related domain-containing protein [Lentinula raphanica]KAJ3964785.1 ubiquitin-related domain-containing protein [Lentinula raphanica]